MLEHDFYIRRQKAVEKRRKRREVEEGEKGNSNVTLNVIHFERDLATKCD